MNINPFIEPKFLTIEQTAKFLNVAIDIVIALIEQRELFVFAAIPSTAMVLVPKGREDTMKIVFSNPELYSDELQKWTEDKSGIFRIQGHVGTSVAINGSALISTIWTTTPEDEGIGIDSLSDDDKKILNSRCFWLRQPIAISLSNIRIPLYFLQKLHDFSELKIRIREQEESWKEQQLKEKPLHENERRTLLAIIRALAELNGIKPIKTREGGDGWRKAAEGLLAELGAKGITAPVKDPQTLAEKLREACSPLRG